MAKIKEKLQVQDLKDIPIGGKEAFYLPDAKAIRNAKSLISQHRDEYNISYTTDKVEFIQNDGTSNEYYIIQLNKGK